METPLALFLSDVGRTLWAAGSRTTGAIEAQGASSKFGPKDSRSFARGSMELALSIARSHTSFVRDVAGNWGADGPADVEARIVSDGHAKARAQIFRLSASAGGFACRPPAGSARLSYNYN